jgi:hypothetical protein
MSVQSALRFKTLSHAVACDSVSESQNVFGLNSPRYPEWHRIDESASHILFQLDCQKALQNCVASATAFDIIPPAPTRQGRAVVSSHESQGTEPPHHHRHSSAANRKP